MPTTKKTKQYKSKTLRARSKLPLKSRSRSPSNNLIKESIQFNEYSQTKIISFNSSLNKTELKSINYYQEGSSLINGFLREGYSFLSEFNKKTIINSLVKSNFKSAIKDLIKKINSIDKVFTKTNCPKTTQNTMLYRGTEKFYPGINKGYTSCSKSMEALFDMKFVKGDVGIMSDDCCINILIVDPNIPYLDLENNSDKWKYQQEVLLPRGLNTELIEESTTKYNERVFKVYVMRVMINNNENLHTSNPNEYIIPELPKDDSVDITKINFIINEQRTEIIKLLNMFLDTNEWPDEKEDINDLIEYIYDLQKKGIFTKEDYKNICKKILNTLKKLIPAMMTSKIVRDECKQNLQPVLDKVEKILSSDDQLITPGQFIEVDEC
jgi:hypothetical protein